MLTLTRARFPPLPSFSTYVLNLTRRLLRPLRTRAFPHTTSRHPSSLLRMSSVALRHPFSLYCACLSENPFLTHLHSHLPLTSTAAANGSTRVVASASLNVFSTTNLDGRTHLHLYTISLYPLIYQSPRQHTHNSHIPTLSISRYVIGHMTFAAGHTTSNYTFSSSPSSDAQRPPDGAQRH